MARSRQAPTGRGGARGRVAVTAVTTVATEPRAPAPAPSPAAIRSWTSPWPWALPGTLGVAAATGLVLFEALDALVGRARLRYHAGRGVGHARGPRLRGPCAGGGGVRTARSAEPRPLLRPRSRPRRLLPPSLRPRRGAVHDVAERRQRGRSCAATPHGWRRVGRRTGSRWIVVLVTLAAMTCATGSPHVGDHRVGALWRIHVLHHSQEELSVLTSFRAHPLMHTTGFVLATGPVLLLTGAHPGHRCSSPSTSVWGPCRIPTCAGSYGTLGRFFVSPAYHRLHHAAEGEQDVNLGVVLTVWDVMFGLARFPARGSAPCETGRPPSRARRAVGVASSARRA